MKSATEILHEYGINVLNFEDDFNSQLLTAMDEYANQFKEKQECKKPCGDNYCDENGCTDRKRHYTPLRDLPMIQ